MIRKGMTVIVALIMITIMMIKVTIMITLIRGH